MKFIFKGLYSFLGLFGVIGGSTYAVINQKPAIAQKEDSTNEEVKTTKKIFPDLLYKYGFSKYKYIDEFISWRKEAAKKEEKSPWSVQSWDRKQYYAIGKFLSKYIKKTNNKYKEIESRLYQLNIMINSKDEKVIRETRYKILNDIIETAISYKIFMRNYN